MCSFIQVLARSRGTEITGAHLAEVVAAWRTYFDIGQVVTTERISRFQVTGEDGHAGAALIGVTCDANSAIIYHTRRLTVEDLIHELLHVAHPDWSEAHVVYETDRVWRPRLIVPPALNAAQPLAA